MKAILVFVTLLISASIAFGEDGAQRSVTWDSSRMASTPEAPLPYTIERAYPKLSFQGPLFMAPIPADENSTGSSFARWAICQQDGKIFSFKDDQACEQLDLMADFRATPPPHSNFSHQPGLSLDVYGFAFHPKFRENRFIYVCYLVVRDGGGKQEPNGTHVARFRLSDDAIPKIEIDSEKTILTCDSGGHNGCMVEFGNDGMLYFSIGDLKSPTPPDALGTGQRIDDFYSSILRVDVDLADADQGYTIPPDNPFADAKQYKGEVYAYGFRNPWRFSFDRASGDLWVGDVGWEAWEMVYRVRSGGNYGWPIKEGPGDVLPDHPRGPTPILAADVALTHAEAASVTGGYVYHGKQFPDLQGKYIFGDWITRKYWSVSFDEQKVTAVEEIAYGNIKPVSFALDRAGELLILDYSDSSQQAGIYRLVPNPEMAKFAGGFPKKLSETGLFADVTNQTPAPGVYPYQINAPMFMDGATSERFVALSSPEPSLFYQSPQKTFDWFNATFTLPAGSVLVKTYSLETKDDSSENNSDNRGTIIKKRIETQISQYIGPGDWRYYSYRWNDQQDDATLVSANGDVATIQLDSPHSEHGSRELSWVFSGRNQCRICHTPWSGDALAWLETQLRNPQQSSDSWRELIAAKVIAVDSKTPPKPNDQFIAMVDPYSPQHSLELRARSYLHTNCAHCHLYGGNGSAMIDVRWEKKLEEYGLVDAKPMKGSCGYDDPKLIAPGRPEDSILLYRLAKNGSGRMPHIGSQSVDRQGVKLVRDWIRELKKPDERAEAELVKMLSESLGKNPEDAQAWQRLKELSGKTAGMMSIIEAIDDHQISNRVKDQLISNSPTLDPMLRDLIEPLARPDQLPKRLGSKFDSTELLAMQGDKERGRKLMLAGAGQCIQCHKLEQQGKELGPDLSQIGTKLNREKILKSILEPSVEISLGYQAITIQTTDGETFVGRELERDKRNVVLQEANGTVHRIATGDIEREKRSEVSLMPEQLLAPLTAQEAIDLLTYLSSLR